MACRSAPVFIALGEPVRDYLLQQFWTNLANVIRPCLKKYLKMPLIPATMWEASLHYEVRPCLKQINKQKLSDELLKLSRISHPMK